MIMTEPATAFPGGLAGEFRERAAVELAGPYFLGCKNLM
jgi:hypothetical protein